VPGDTTPASRPIGFAAADDADELARAEVYGVLARLFVAPPDAALHAQFAVAVTEAPARGAFLERSWGELVEAARRLGVEAIAAEFDVLFQGIGKPEILPYASFHVTGRLHDRPLVEIRDALRELGLAGADESGVSEDHIGAVCEVMRYLIAGDDPATCQLETQRRFFTAHLQPWASSLCDSLEGHPRADFYRALGRFTRDFVAVEAQAFDLLDA
jgi:TorA maturation chaperone TorD